MLAVEVLDQDNDEGLNVRCISIVEHGIQVADCCGSNVAVRHGLFGTECKAGDGASRCIPSPRRILCV